MPNLESLHACNPSFTICLQKEDYYVNLAVTRGEDVVKRMRRAIALSPNKPTYQLLSGHVGSGKSTELLRLKFELEQQGFAVIYCAADKYLQIDDFGLIEVWLAILTMILQQTESKGDLLSLVYLPNAIAEIEKWLRSATLGMSSYVERLQGVLQALQDSEQHRRQLHYYLAPKIKDSLIAAIEEVTGIEVDRLKQLGKKGLVILVDNLDRLSLEQAEIIFAEGGKYLRQFPCHMVYTLPLFAIADHGDKFQQLFEKYGNAPIVLPNLQLCDRDGVINSESLNLLRQVVLARILPSVHLDQRLEQITNCFDRLETLDQLCLASHGHLPYLLSLLQGCLQQQDPPIALETLQQVLESDRAMRLSTISDRDRQALQECLTNAYALTPEALNLCRRLLLFEHRDASGYWFSSPFDAE